MFVLKLQKILSNINMNHKRKHFHTLDAIRFFSFLLVLLLHIPHEKSSIISFFSKSGGIGVSFFFVLSGFLITYIILFEKKNYGFLSLKKFFIRRILRIWPLFYAMILFAYLTPYILNLLKISSSNDGYEPNLLTSLLFLENYKMMITNSFPNTSPLRVMWSLCIEEHFYIIWAIILKFIPSKKTPILIFVSIIIANISRFVYNFYDLNTIDIFTNIDYFAFGAIPAYIVILKESLLRKIKKISLMFKYFFTVTTISLIFLIPNIDSGNTNHLLPTIFGFLFSTVLLFTLPSTNFVHINDKYWFSKLGKYTYGLYLFHTIIINLILQAESMFPFKTNWLTLTSLTLVISTITSVLSFHLFEKQFLKLKRNFNKK
jgi:peptidoglycan/LPS O-acetylase OafA/YrhL